MNEGTPTAPAAPHAPKQPAISFEFFPPKTAEMEKSLWDTINRLAPLIPEFRLGDLWRRRIDPRAHPLHHRPHPRRD